MGEQQGKLEGSDLTKGVSLSELRDGGTLLGHAHGEPVVLARTGDEVFAVGAQCSHYGGPLAEGLVVGKTLRCPWHHACFDLQTGAPSSPALNAIPCWRVIREGELVRVADRIEPRVEPPHPMTAKQRVVIVGAGPAGAVCAEALRRRGFAGEIVMLGQEPTQPLDRPNLSKDYLAGNAPDEWLPLRPADFYVERRIDFRPGTVVHAIDAEAKRVTLESGEPLAYDHLVLATGAEPRKLDVPGAERVLYLRTLADANRVISAAAKAKKAVVLGASFIGLEVAASLRTRGLDVTVVAPDEMPLGRVLGRELSELVRSLHVEKGVTFALGRRPKSINAGEVLLDDGSTLAAELVVAGVGVRPRTELAEQAGLHIDDGVVVDASLRAGDSIFAVGDVARWPDPRTGRLQRIEHFVVAERLGEHAARVITGAGDERFTDVPFFWSVHYDVSIRYTGNGRGWERLVVDGDVMKRDATVRYYKGDALVAVATVGRDHDALEAERDLRA